MFGTSNYLVINNSCNHDNEWFFRTENNRCFNTVEFVGNLINDVVIWNSTFKSRMSELHSSVVRAQHLSMAGKLDTRVKQWLPSLQENLICYSGFLCNAVMTGEWCYFFCRGWKPQSYKNAIYWIVKLYKYFLNSNGLSEVTNR